MLSPFAASYGFFVVSARICQPSLSRLRTEPSMNSADPGKQDGPRRSLHCKASFLLQSSSDSVYRHQNVLQISRKRPKRTFLACPTDARSSNERWTDKEKEVMVILWMASSFRTVPPWCHCKMQRRPRPKDRSVLAPVRRSCLRVVSAFSECTRNIRQNATEIGFLTRINP